MAEEVTKQTQDPLAEKIGELEEAKRLLEDVEIKALSDVAGTNRSGRMLISDDEGVD